MQIGLTLTQPADFPKLPPQYEEELDDTRAIISDICDALADSSSAEFVISGFGQDRWPVDARTDLATLLEQLPSAIASIQSGVSFSLDFYEQGVERTIHFERTGDNYSAHCESRSNWQPSPTIETISRVELQGMLVAVRTNLMQFLLQNAPHTANHPWIKHWASDSTN